MTIFLCDDTMEGIFTAVYDAWASRLGHANVKLQIRGATRELFADYREVQTDMEKAEKVARTIKRELGEEGWEQISRAALAAKKERADAIYRVLVLALSKGRKQQVLQDSGSSLYKREDLNRTEKMHRGKSSDILAQIQNPFVCLVMELARSVWHETHRYMGFVRFRELQSGVLFSEIAPENQVLPLLGAHFADRFPREHFLIFDHTHRDVLAHEAGGSWWILRDVPMEQKKFEAGPLSNQEEEFQRLWRGFCSRIFIRERENPQLQRQLWPYKFRKWMTEGQKDW